MAEADKLCCIGGEGENTCIECSMQDFKSDSNFNSSYSSVHVEGHLKRTKHIPQLSTLTKSLLLYGTLFIVICMLTAVIVLLAVPSNEPPLQPVPPVELKRTCLNCTTLTRIVDTWAWKNITKDKQTGQCCFNSDTGLFATLKSYIDTRLSNNQLETDQLRKDTEVLHNLAVNHLLKHNSNDTSISQFTHPDLQTLIDLINNVFHRKRSVLHITSLSTIMIEGEDPKVSWKSQIKQGNISLSNDSLSFTVMNTGLYFISTHVKFRASVFNNTTRGATVQFHLGTLRRGQFSHVDDYKKRCVFSERNIEHDAILHTMSRLETGDNLYIRFPRSQKLYLHVASELGAHRISIFEL